VCGPRAVRIDILERLADLIRPLLGWRPSADGTTLPPKGATGDGAFMTTPEMMSLLGCSPEELSGVLKALGFRLERRPVKADTGAAATAATQAAEAAPAEAVASAPEAVADATVAADMTAPALAPAQPETEPQAATETVIAAEPGAASAPAAEETRYEEIWRPRRHPRGEHRRPAPGRPPRRSEHKESGPRPQTPTAVAAPVSAPANANGNGERAVRDARSEPPKGNRPERGRDAHARRPGKAPERSGKGPDRRRREEHRKPEVHSAAPPRRASIDADSPFAALGALRDALVKRGKETSS
jgi:ATP-dependent RNA helicase SUPV3L1/SUV3